MGTLRLYYEEKNILRPIGAFFLLKLKVTKIPICIQNRAKTALPAIFILVPAIGDHAVKAFLDARGPM